MGNELTYDQFLKSKEILYKDMEEKYFVIKRGKLLSLVVSVLVIAFGVMGLSLWGTKQFVEAKLNDYATIVAKKELIDNAAKSTEFVKDLEDNNKEAREILDRLKAAQPRLSMMRVAEATSGEGVEKWPKWKHFKWNSDTSISTGGTWNAVLDIEEPIPVGTEHLFEGDVLPEVFACISSIYVGLESNNATPGLMLDGFRTSVSNVRIEKQILKFTLSVALYADSKSNLSPNRDVAKVAWFCISPVARGKNMSNGVHNAIFSSN